MKLWFQRQPLSALWWRVRVKNCQRARFFELQTTRAWMMAMVSIGLMMLALIIFFRKGNILISQPLQPVCYVQLYIISNDFTKK
jgi:hypothetical protein